MQAVLGLVEDDRGEFWGRLTYFGLQLSMLSPDIPRYTNLQRLVSSSTAYLGFFFVGRSFDFLSASRSLNSLYLSVRSYMYSMIA